MQNDLIENIVINDLSSNANANYKLNVNLNNFTSDTITVNGSASGVITISDLNYLGSLTLEDVGKHPIKVLNTNSNSVTLALSDAVKDSSFILGDIRRDEQDTVAMITNFNTVYYNRYRLGNIVGKLSVSSDSKDSITIDAVDQWSNTSTATSVLGDTLQ